MKTRLVILFALASACCMAQQLAPADSLSLRERARQWNQEQYQKVKDWDTEHSLDSLDQEKLPKVVSGGLLVAANISNFIITDSYGTMSSYMRVGAEFGGFIDFRVTKHFAIQGRLMFNTMQNKFGDGRTDNELWSFGIDIPVYFMGRFGNLTKGYLQFGAGPFTHFNFASNVSLYTNNEAKKTNAPAPKAPSGNDYSSLYALHDNHSGIAATIGYEFPMGLQIVANYNVSLSDIITYYKNSTTTVKQAAIYPQYVSLGIGYRWK
ncbi:MAG: PorT family protein [Paludibacteraceae bacterium]|nr:PorT family protein [Paludibacteraceae bacterium]